MYYIDKNPPKISLKIICTAAKLRKTSLRNPFIIYATVNIHKIRLYTRTATKTYFFRNIMKNRYTV